jgi:hypothetical protein
MIQPTLFDGPSFSATAMAQNKLDGPDFDGVTFDDKKDGARLNKQLRKVFDLMSDGRWRTLDEISSSVGAPMQSVSARLRDLRKPKHGSHTIERKSLGKGLFSYRLIPSSFL